MKLTDSVTELKGIGDELAKKFARLGVKTIDDLLHYFPRGYDDYSNIVLIDRLNPGQVTIKAVIKQASGHYVRGGLHITEAVASDEASSVRLVWFNQPYRAASLKTDMPYYISGDFGLRAKRMSILNPSVELVSNFPVNTARIVPIYPLTQGITSQAIRKALKAALESLDLNDNLPKEIVKQYQLMTFKDAVKEVHFPVGDKSLAEARFRLGFEEVFGLILASLLNKQEVANEKSLAIKFEESIAKDFVKHLPFKLTDGQRAAAWQIYQDMSKTRPMNRLLEGDVGSGKTVVAAMSSVMAIKEGFQVALMAPTELLARQHAETIYGLLKPLGLHQAVSLLVGGLKLKQKQLAHSQVSEGKAQLLVGTHALIQEKVDMHNLGLVIIDEQHRFGAEQRKALIAKAGHMPHVLSMTATPIPRSLALTLYGELDISVLPSKPKNRLPIKTKIVSLGERPKLYKEIDKELKKGRQMFVVSPLIESSKVIAVKSATEVLEGVKKVFPHYKTGLLHGRMKSDEKQAVMQDFVDGKLNILVSTTVIEVGVDVPNATVMLIEGPERFGLAQIHQLRGRVGRSEHQGYCYLLLNDSMSPSKRLRAIESKHDGFELAELDLELRGPGALFGTKQHGELDLRIAKLSDTKLIAKAREAAKAYIESKPNLLQYPQLSERVNRLRSVVHLN